MCTHRSRASIILAPLILAGSVACADVSDTGPQDVWELQLLSSFGDPGIEEDAEIGVIGSPTATTWSPAGPLVADQQGSQLVWFNPSGAAMAALGGNGDGPGEFRRVRDVTLTGDSLVSALDLDNGRVTTFRVPSFDLDTVVSGIPPDGFFHAWVGDTIWIVRPNRDGPSSPLATGYLASSGVEVAAAPPAHPEDQPYGGAFGLDTSPTRLVTSTPRPGVWWERASGDWRRVGQPLFPEAPPRKDVDVQPGLVQRIPSPAVAFDIVILGDSIIAQLIVMRPGVQETDDPRTVPREVSLGVFSVDGNHLATIPVDPEISCVASAPDSTLLLCAWGPFPQIRRFRLARTPR